MHSDQKMLDRIYYQALFPNMVAILGGTINVLFDGILTGRKMGDLGIASINQSLAVYLILCTIGSLIAAGASAESAASIGANRTEEGSEYFTLAMGLAIGAGILVCGLGFALSGPIAMFLGSEGSWKLVETYIRITFAGGIFKILLYIPFFYLKLEGKMRQSAYAMVTMTVLNIVLDYVFLFVFEWGIGGAAWASTLATAAACTMSYFFLMGPGAKCSFRLCRLKGGDNKQDRAAMVFRIIKSGSPMAANNLFSSLRIICLNSIMNQVGGSGMVAVFGITNSLNEFSISIQNGVPQAGSAMLGICHGEQDTVSVKHLLKLQAGTGFVLSCVFGLALVLGGNKVGLLFGSQMDIRFAAACLAASIVIGTFNSVMSYYYYATMKPGMANLITILRVFAATVLAAWLFRPLEDGIWVFYWVGELATAAVWMAAGMAYGKRRLGACSLYLLDETAFLSGKCKNFTVACNAADICDASEKIQEFCQYNSFTPDQTMTISLALEELMVIVAEKSMDNQGTMDVRILRTKEGGIIRIRSEGRRYNPLEFAEESLDYLGVSMIMKMAEKTEYHSILGLNTLIVFI